MAGVFFYEKVIGNFESDNIKERIKKKSAIKNNLIAPLWYVSLKLLQGSHYIK